MIHVCYSINDKGGHYSKFAGVSMYSMFEHTQEKICVHILTDGSISESNRQKILQVADKFNQSIQFHNVTDNISQKFKDTHSIRLKIYTTASLYRCLIPEIVNESKAIYLDSDTIVNLDINELWSIDLKNYPLAAKAEQNIFDFEIPPDIREKIDFENIYLKPLIIDGKVKSENYFNAAVMLMNLDYLRKINLYNRSVEFLSDHPEYVYMDQDALNGLLADNYLHLPAKFDTFTWQLRNFLKLYGAEIDKAECIFHFGGMDYGFDTKFLPNKLFFQTLLKTPWAVESFQNMFEFAIKSADETKLNFQRIMKSNNRIFFATDDLLPYLLEIFRPNDNDLVTSNVDVVLKNMNNRICIFLTQFPKQTSEITNLFQSHGFIENQDFFEAKQLLTKDQGVSTNPKHFMRNL